MYTLRKEYKTIVLSVFISLFLASVILIPYIIASNLSVGSLVYPLLGRGWHISSDPHFIIHSSVSIIDHLTNLAKVSLKDLFILMILVLYIISLRRFNNKAFHHFIVLAYIVFYVIMIISTGGLSASRYVFPVSLAIIVFQSVLLLNSMGGTLDPLEGVDANSAKIRIAAIFAYFLRQLF